MSSYHNTGLSAIEWSNLRKNPIPDCCEHFTRLNRLIRSIDFSGFDKFSARELVTEYRICYQLHAMESLDCYKELAKLIAQAQTALEEHSEYSQYYEYHWQ